MPDIDGEIFHIKIAASSLSFAVFLHPVGPTLLYGQTFLSAAIFFLIVTPMYWSRSMPNTPHHIFICCMVAPRDGKGCVQAACDHGRSLSRRTRVIAVHSVYLYLLLFFPLSGMRCCSLPLQRQYIIIYKVKNIN